MIPLILASTLFSSPRICYEYGWELYNAADRRTLEQADTLFERCDATNQNNPMKLNQILAEDGKN